MYTPEFLVWAVEYTCPVRGFQNGSDPERTERQLRAARAVSDARREGREFEGFCLDLPNGFRIEDALAVYGGLEAVERACLTCAANVLNQTAKDTLAGCFGTVILYGTQSFFRAVDVAAEAFASDEALFPLTKPRWYGMWIESPIQGRRAELTARILESLDEEFREALPGLSGLVSALRHASDQGLAIHVHAYPQSSTEVRGWWHVAAHCPRCKVTWAMEAGRVCPACGYDGKGVPLRKRRARGSRPYFPLTRLLGETAAAELLVRYQRYRTQRESSQSAGSEPPVARPNSLPGD